MRLRARSVRTPAQYRPDDVEFHPSAITEGQVRGHGGENGWAMADAAWPQLERFAFAARYLPATQSFPLGGDWYDILPLSDCRVAIAVGDVVGHGPSTAATMRQLRSALAGFLLAGYQPARALTHLDRFARHVKGALASSATCIVLDANNHDLTWASAGHPPPLIIDAHGARYLDGTTGTVLAVDPRPRHRARHITLEPDTSVLLYTDGLIERRGKTIDDGLTLLAEVATTLRSIAPPQLLAGILDTLLGTSTPNDDIALVLTRPLPERRHHPDVVPLPTGTEAVKRAKTIQRSA